MPGSDGYSTSDLFKRLLMAGELLPFAQQLARTRDADERMITFVLKLCGRPGGIRALELHQAAAAAEITLTQLHDAMRVLLYAHQIEPEIGLAGNLTWQNTQAGHTFDQLLARLGRLLTP